MVSDNKIFPTDSYSECVSSQRGPLNSPCAPNWIKWVEAVLHTKYQGTRHCCFRQEDLVCFPNIKVKAEDKNQKSIQSSTPIDPRHNWKREKMQENTTHKSAKRSALSQQVITCLCKKYATSRNVTFKPQGYNLNKLGGGLLGYATYQILRL